MRTCFLLQVRQEKIAEYKERHKEVWPEMQEALRKAGWKNYSLYLRPDGLLVGYVEADDFDACRARMKEYAVNERWQAEMAPYFENSDKAADDVMKPLEEVFHLN